MNKEEAIKKAMHGPAYISPIELELGETTLNFSTMVARKLAAQQEEMVVEAVQSVGIKVDKEELLKALQFDRDQYARGWQQAKRAYKRPHGAWIYQTARSVGNMIIAQCDRCKAFGTVGGWCSNCGADMGGGDDPQYGYDDGEGV